MYADTLEEVASSKCSQSVVEEYNLWEEALVREEKLL